MSHLSIWIATALAIVPAIAPAGAAEEKPETVLMFGARWCAPCMAEYRDLPGLVAAAAPDHVVLAWIDRAMPPPSALQEAVKSLASEEAQRLAHAIGGEGYGLPFSVLLDRTGHACAIWRAPLHASDLAAFRGQCDRARPSAG